MTAKTKYSLKLIFGSLIKNDLAIEGAKTLPWWVATIMYVIGTFIPVIPIMVNASKTYGASFVSSNVYDYDQALVSCGVELKTEHYLDLRIEESKLLAYEFNSETNEFDKLREQTWVEKKDLEPIASYDREFEGKTTRALNVYYTDRPTSGKQNSVSTLITAIESQTYVLGTNRIYDAEVDTEVDAKKGVYIPSYLILYKDGLYSKIYKTNTTTAASSTYGGLDWKHADFTNLLDRVVMVDGIEANLNNRRYINASFANWKVIFNDCYKNQKVNNFWMTSGLYYGIYLILGVFMGLMMFLLTRGKANPNRGLNFWITTKISWWIDISPGILAMILGFIWGQAAGLGYIVLFGLRTMWLSMRSLSPAQNQ